MNKSIIIPVIITLLQIASFVHLHYTHKYKSGQFPADFIELNFLAIINIIILIIAYFFYFNTEKKEIIWLVSIGLAVMTIFLLIILYILMFMNKY
jgi:hypothetical protein